MAAPRSRAATRDASYRGKPGDRTNTSAQVAASWSGTWPSSVARFGSANADLTATSLTAGRLMASMFPSIMIVLNVSTVAAVWIGGNRIGVITDTALCPDPQKIIDEFEPEFAKLSLVTLMLPWGE